MPLAAIAGELAGEPVQAGDQVVGPAAHLGVAGQQTTLPGNIQAWYEAPLYARVSGYLKKWYEDYGAHVKKGQIMADLEVPDIDKELKSTLELGTTLDLEGTPAFIVGDTIVPGAVSSDALKQLIATARGK